MHFRALLVWRKWPMDMPALQKSMSSSRKVLHLQSSKSTAKTTHSYASMRKTLIFSTRYGTQLGAALRRITKYLTITVSYAIGFLIFFPFIIYCATRKFISNRSRHWYDFFRSLWDSTFTFTSFRFGSFVLVLFFVLFSFFSFSFFSFFCFVFVLFFFIIWSKWWKSRGNHECKKSRRKKKKKHTRTHTHTHDEHSDPYRTMTLAASCG